MASQNRSYDPPISSPPDVPPRTVLQVDTQSETSEWGAIPRVVPRPEGGVPLQRSIGGKSDGPTR
jgi:hypothetical protein